MYLTRFCRLAHFPITFTTLVTSHKKDNSFIHKKNITDKFFNFIILCLLLYDNRGPKFQFLFSKDSIAAISLLSFLYSIYFCGPISWSYLNFLINLIIVFWRKWKVLFHLSLESRSLFHIVIVFLWAISKSSHSSNICLLVRGPVLDQQSVRYCYSCGLVSIVVYLYFYRAHRSIYLWSYRC
jgi:hypothetical protein